MYLVVAETISHTNEKIILGVARTNSEALSLIYNFFKMCSYGCPENTFEGSIIHFNLIIYEITPSASRYIVSLADPEVEKPSYIEDNLYGNWLFITYQSSEGGVTIPVKDANKIQSIISKAKVII